MSVDVFDLEGLSRVELPPFPPGRFPHLDKGWRPRWSGTVDGVLFYLEAALALRQELPHTVRQALDHARHTYEHQGPKAFLEAWGPYIRRPFVPGSMDALRAAQDAAQKHHRAMTRTLGTSNDGRDLSTTPRSRKRPPRYWWSDEAAADRQPGEGREAEGAWR